MTSAMLKVLNPFGWVGAAVTTPPVFRPPHDPWPFVVCTVALVVFVALVVSAAALANRRDAARARRERMERLNLNRPAKNQARPT
jgi:hypothetical protein